MFKTLEKTNAVLVQILIDLGGEVISISNIVIFDKKTSDIEHQIKAKIKAY